MSANPRFAKEGVGCVLLTLACAYFVWQAAELTTKQPGGPMALGMMAKGEVFLFTILPAIALWIGGYLLCRSATLYRTILYGGTFAAILFVIRMNLVDAPAYPSDYYAYGATTTVAAYFKGIVAPPGVTDNEPGDYFPASDECVVFFLGISLLMLVFALWNGMRILHQHKEAPDLARLGSK